MNEEKNLEEINLNKTQHIEKYKRHPLVNKVLLEQTSFKKEVNRFYNFSTKITDTQKEGICPEDLVDILGGFREKPFDTSKLNYDLVREDHQRQESQFNKTINRSAVKGVITVGAVGAMAVLANTGNYLLAAIAGVFSLCGAYSITQTIFDIEPSETNEFGEYQNLFDTARTADQFINDEYKASLDNKVLEN